MQEEEEEEEVKGGGGGCSPRALSIECVAYRMSVFFETVKDNLMRGER